MSHSAEYGPDMCIHGMCAGLRKQLKHRGGEFCVRIALQETYYSQSQQPVIEISGQGKHSQLQCHCSKTRQYSNQVLSGYNAGHQVGRRGTTSGHEGTPSHCSSLDAAVACLCNLGVCRPPPRGFEMLALNSLQRRYTYSPRMNETRVRSLPTPQNKQADSPYR